MTKPRVSTALRCVTLGERRQPITSTLKGLDQRDRTLSGFILNLPFATQGYAAKRRSPWALTSNPFGVHAESIRRFTTDYWRRITDNPFTTASATARRCSSRDP